MGIPIVKYLLLIYSPGAISGPQGCLDICDQKAIEFVWSRETSAFVRWVNSPKQGLFLLYIVLYCLHCLSLMNTIFFYQYQCLRVSLRSYFPILQFLFFLPISLPCHTHSPHSCGYFLTCQEEWLLLRYIDVGADGLAPPPLGAEWQQAALQFSLWIVHSCWLVTVSGTWGPS